MTTEEKICQLTSIWLTFDSDKDEMAPHTDAMFPLDFDIEYFLTTGIGQITRPFGSQPIDPKKGAEMVNRIQKRLMEETRLGIPAICHEECLAGFMAQGATSFPLTGTFTLVGNLRYPDEDRALFTEVEVRSG
jgi:beta-xylosidase